MNHTVLAPVDVLRHTRSGFPSPSRSPRAASVHERSASLGSITVARRDVSPISHTMLSPVDVLRHSTSGLVSPFMSAAAGRTLADAGTQPKSVVGRTTDARHALFDRNHTLFE